MNNELVNKYDEIESIKKSFLEWIAHTPDTILNKIPSDGGWSLGQVYFHLYFSESGSIKVIQKNINENKIINSSGLSDKIRNFLLICLLKSHIKFKAPSVASKVPDFITVDEIKSLFDKNTTAYKTLLYQLPKEMENKQIFKHPIAGLFNIEQTLGFVKNHYLHHEMQIKSLLK